MPTIRNLEGQFHAQISMLWQPLNDEPAVAYHADRPVKTASIIKLPILIHAALLVESGQLSWDQRLPLSGMRSPGMGILKVLDDGLQPTVRDVAVLMTVISDNTATNMLIDLLGIDQINQRIQALGMHHTRLNRKVFAPNTEECLPWGLGVTTARDVVHVLTAIANGQIGNTATSRFLQETLAKQQDRVGFPRGLPAGWSYAGKTGSDDDLRNDCAIVTSPDGRRYVCACFVQDMSEQPSTVDHPGLQALGQVMQIMIS
ncbi:MAG: serine hydrolase [Chloroflexota bacterium]|jgi:beta-lactamase class A